MTALARMRIRYYLEASRAVLGLAAAARGVTPVAALGNPWRRPSFQSSDFPARLKRYSLLACPEVCSAPG
jgi:hypothetical protein